MSIWLPTDRDAYFSQDDPQYTGLDPETPETLADLERLLQPFPVDAMAVGDDDIPKECDTRGMVKDENQQNFNSCCGFAGATTHEFGRALDTGENQEEESEQSSSMFAWFETQRITRGKYHSGGAVISHCAKLITETGLPPASLFDYPKDRRSSFNAVLSGYRQAVQNPKVRESLEKMRYATRCKSYDQYIKFVGTRMGGCLLGSKWGLGSPTSARGMRCYERFSPGRGAHAIAALGYLWHRGTRYPLIHNSHGDRTLMVSPDVFEGMLASLGYEAILLSGMENPRPRIWTPDQHSLYYRDDRSRKMVST